MAFCFFNLKMLNVLLCVLLNVVLLPKISIKQVIFIMKQLHFYQNGGGREVDYIKTLPNWTGEVPQQGDFVKLHFGDNHEEEYAFRVLYRIIDGRKPDDVDIYCIFDGKFHLNK